MWVFVTLNYFGVECLSHVTIEFAVISFHSETVVEKWAFGDTKE